MGRQMQTRCASGRPASRWPHRCCGQLAFPNKLCWDAVSSDPQTNARPNLRTDSGHSISGPSWRTLGVLLSALILWAVTATGQVIARKPDEVKVGQTLRDATMRGLNGPDHKLSDYRGRPLVINVWASWCGPCRQEMASLERLAWQEHAVPFAVIGISTDDYPERAKQLLKVSNATISHFIDSNLQLEMMLGASRLPLTVLVDADGRVVAKIYGAKQWDGSEAKTLIGNAFQQQGPAPRR
jgi:thiol-disulfide isomerase/thioredoxin